MLIFQANDKVPLNDELFKQWDEYLTRKCQDEEPILLPKFIDFCCIANENMFFQPSEDLFVEEIIDDDNNEEDGFQDINDT